MGKRITHDEYVQLLNDKNPNLEVIETYVNANTKILHRCIKHNKIFEKRPYNALKGEGCKQCSNDVLANKHIKTQEQYIKEVKDINPDIEVIGEYKGAHKRIAHKCLVHNITWDTSPTSILMGCGCKECAKEKHYAKSAKTHNQYVEELKIANPNIDVLEKYIDSLTPILHKCKKDGYEWRATPTNLLYRTGCPKCSKVYRKTHDDYVEELKTKNPTIVVIDNYIDAKTPIKHKCLVHDVEWNISPTGALRGNGCPKCGSERLSLAKSKTHEEYLKELHETHPNIDPLEEYKGANIRIKHRCNLDGYEWNVTPSCLLNHGCPKCANKAPLTQSDYVERLNKINSNLTVIGQYINAKSLIRVKCNVDGYEWESRADVLLRGARCPICEKKSLGEISIAYYLDNNNIKYEPQKRFDDCKNIKPLPFDFYIPDINTCIEYDGIQHFEPIDFAGHGSKWAEENFKKTKERDRIKTEYCKSKGIRLIRIPYFNDVKKELNLLFT